MSHSSLQQATDYRKNKQFKAALTIYQPLWQENPEQFGEWDGWSYAYSLKELGLFNEALEVCRKLYPRFKHSEFISGLYAQCIYYTQIKTETPKPIETQRKAVQGMIRLSPPHREYSLSGVAIFRLCKNLMELNPVPWQEIESWLNYMDPDLLSIDSFQGTLLNGKTISYASQQEEWYSMMIRVKAGQKQPEELIKFLDEAKRKNIRWHYQNDVWMERKRALAYAQLDRPDEAEGLLQQILIKKKDWFIYADLGDVVTDPEKKLQWYSQAALTRGKLAMKINLFKKLSDVLAQNPEHKESYQQHLLLIARIRMENGWDIPADIDKLLTENNIDLGSVNGAEEAYKKLYSFWETHSGREKKERQEGEISHIMPHGRAGFIKAGKNNYYFQIGKHQDHFKERQRVSFELIDSFDRSKNKASKIAIKVKSL